MSAGSVPISLKETVPGRRPGLVSVSFTGTEAGQDLDRLLAADTRGRAAHRLDPLGDMTPLHRPVPLQELARAYAEVLNALEPPPVALVGHCSAALLTQAVAGELASRPPRVLLLDPAVPTPESVAATFAELRRGLGRIVPGADEDSAVVRRCAEDPQAALEWMSTVLAGDADAFCAESGLGEDAEAVTGELVPRYRAWLALLLGAAHHTPGTAAGPAHCLLSRDRALPPGLPGRDTMTVRRLELAAAELTSAAPVRELLLDLVEEGAHA